MRLRKPSWDVITEKVIVGTCPTERSAIEEIKQEAECTAIFCLQSDDDLNQFGIDWYDLQSHAEELGVVMKRVPMRDFDLDDQRRNLAEAVHCLATLIEDGHKVYVHCTAGMNRSPLVVLGYLTFCEGVSLEEAGMLLVTQRPSSAPPIEVWRSVRRDLLAKRGEEVEEMARSISATGPLEGGKEAEAERRILRHIFLPSAS